MGINWDYVVSVVGVVLSILFFVRSGLQLRDESKRLRAKTDMVLHGLEDAGLVRWKKTPDGEVFGIKITLKGSATESDSAGGELTVDKEEPPTN
ncbi:MAG: hypothetical protein ABR529_15775 [Actinomycetota bacterium]